MQRIALAASLVFASGCANAYRVSYVTGAVTKQFTTESYAVYSEQFNARLTQCDPQNNASVTTKTELDNCMGDKFKHDTHEKIEVTVRAYHGAAKIHTEAMIAVDGTDEEKRAAAQGVLDAAVGLLGLLPDGNKLVKKLKMLAGAR